MAKKTNTNSTKPVTNKAAFVRNLPSDMSAAQVIAKAQASGMKLSPAYVYVIRSKSNAGSNGKTVTPVAGGARSGTPERTFIDLALQIGFLRAQQLLDGVRVDIQRVLQ